MSILRYWDRSPFKPQTVTGGGGDPGGDSELDYIRTFIGAVCTGSTVRHIVENGENIHSIVDASHQKILVKQGELLETSSTRYIKRFKVLVSQPSENLLITTISNLIKGIQKFQRRVVITDYTYKATFIWIELVSCNEGKVNFKSGRWDNQIILDAKFTIF